jgi:hypothetical protein
LNAKELLVNVSKLSKMDRNLLKTSKNLDQERNLYLTIGKADSHTSSGLGIFGNDH